MVSTLEAANQGGTSLLPGVIPAKPGLYRGVPFSDYLKIDAINISRLQRGRPTDAHLRAAIFHPDSEPSAAKDLGTATHCALLEPDRFAREAMIGGPLNPATNHTYGRDTKKWAEYEAANPGRMFISDEEFEAIGLMQASVQRHPKARRLLMASGPCEAVLVWEAVGQLCKARLDKLVPGALAADVKTTDDASDEAFERSVWRFGYWRQIPWYMDGIEAVTGYRMQIPLVVIESTARMDAGSGLCHGVRVLVLDEATVQQGRAANIADLHRLANCRRDNSWAGYSTEVETIGLPRWKQDRSMGEPLGAPPESFSL